MIYGASGILPEVPLHLPAGRRRHVVLRIETIPAFLYG